MDLRKSPTHVVVFPLEHTWCAVQKELSGRLLGAILHSIRHGSQPKLRETQNTRLKQNSVSNAKCDRIFSLERNLKSEIFNF